MWRWHYLQGSGRGAGKAKLKRSSALLGNPAGPVARSHVSPLQSPACEWTAPFRGDAAVAVEAGETTFGWVSLHPHVHCEGALRLV